MGPWTAALAAWEEWVAALRESNGEETFKVANARNRYEAAREHANRVAPHAKPSRVSAVPTKED